MPGISRHVEKGSEAKAVSWSRDALVASVPGERDEGVASPWNIRTGPNQADEPGPYSRPPEPNSNGILPARNDFTWWRFLE